MNIQEELAKIQQTVDLPCTDGTTHKLTFTILKASKESARVLHTAIGIFGKINLPKIDESDPEVDAKKSAVILSYMMTDMPFDALWDLAESLLKLGAVDGVGFRTLEDTQFFNDRHTELCIAVLMGLSVNFPKSFGSQTPAAQALSDAAPVATDLSPVSKQRSMSTRLQRAGVRNGTV